MITERDLEQAIAECQGERHPNANTCIKMAAFLTIKQHLFGEQPQQMAYSFASSSGEIKIDSDSDFARAINGREPSEIMPIMDELMQTLQVVNKRLYEAVMRRIT